MIRPVLTRIHRYVGLALAGFLIVAGLSGSVLAFQSEIDHWLNPGLFRVAETSAPRLSPSQIAALVERADPRIEVLSLVLADSTGESVPVYVGPRPGTATPPPYNQLFVDPGTGKILGRRLNGAVRLDRAHLIPFLFRLHYSLHLPGMWGYWLMGGVALAWMIDCIIGFCLTLPRGRPFWRKWRPIWRVKRGAGPYRLNLDLHRAGGLWLWPVLFALGLSGVALNLNAELFRPVLSAILPTTPTIWEAPPSSPTRPMRLDWDAALSKARAAADARGWDAPVAAIYAVRGRAFYMVRFGQAHQPGFGPSTIYLSATDGHILSVDEAGAGKAGDIVAGLMLPIHSGQIAGLPGRVLICISGLAVAMLSVTGIFVWWKKRLGRVGRKSAASARRYATHSSAQPAAAE